MKKNQLYIMFCLCLWALVSLPDAGARQAPPTPPDQKAYTEARRIKDPQKKVEALDKFIKDFPESVFVSSARQALLETLAKNFPDQKERIRAEAENLILQNSDSVLYYLQLAANLLEAGVLLDYAAELAQKGSARYEEAMATSLRKQKAIFLAILGGIYVKQGKIKEAEKLLKQANENDPTLASAVAGLAEIAERNGDPEAALEYLTSAATLGPMKEVDRKKVETLYRQTHNGSLAGLEEMLDAKYRKLNPLPLRVEPYKATPARTGRVVLAELFTGSGCRPCVAADLGFDALLERYSRQDFALLTYHLHIPQPDPMTNPSAQSRAKFYGEIGTPTYVIDGSQKTGGGSKERTRSFFWRNNSKVEDRLASPPEAKLKLAAALEDAQVKAKVAVEQVKTESSGLKLQIALVENELRYTGENGIRFHPMVVRSLGGKDALGFPVATQGQTAVEWTFDLKAIEGEIKKYLDEYEQEGHKGDKFTFSEKKFQLDPNNLSVVAFMQDEKSKKVLQAAYVKVKPSAKASAQEGGK